MSRVLLFFKICLRIKNGEDLNSMQKVKSCKVGSAFEVLSELSLADVVSVSKPHLKIPKPSSCGIALNN